MSNNRICNICEHPGTFENALEVKKVRSNIRRFLNQEFTVWRCRSCQSLHCLEDIDYAEYYKDYVMEGQKFDHVARIILSQRLAPLKKFGLKREHKILDYGCGTGFFVTYLQEQKYTFAVGYDPYSKKMADASVLNDQFDVVAAQDVIEHVPDPRTFLKTLKSHLKPKGLLAIGTPDAKELDLTNSVDVVGYLHQPFHRHLFTQKELKRMIEQEGFEILYQTKKFYVDTIIPFINTNFLFRYADIANAGFESCLEPINLKLILQNPRLLIYGFLGFFLLKHKSTLIIARLK